MEEREKKFRKFSFVIFYPSPIYGVSSLLEKDTLSLMLSFSTLMPPPVFSTFAAIITTITTPSPNPCFNYGKFGNQPPLLDPTNQYALRQLRQTGSVLDYHIQFETVSCRVLCMPAADHLECFISGLRDDIRHELRLLRPRPYCVSQAFQKAKEIEATFNIPKPSEVANSTPCREVVTVKSQSDISATVAPFSEVTSKTHLPCVPQPPPSKQSIIPPDDAASTLTEATMGTKKTDSNLPQTRFLSHANPPPSEPLSSDRDPSPRVLDRSARALSGFNNHSDTHLDSLVGSKSFTFPIRRWPPSEMHEHRSKDRGFNSDVRFELAHHCPSLLLLGDVTAIPVGDVPIIDTGPYDPGPFESPPPITVTTQPKCFSAAGTEMIDDADELSFNGEIEPLPADVAATDSINKFFRCVNPNFPYLKVRNTFFCYDSNVLPMLPNDPKRDKPVLAPVFPFILAVGTTVVHIPSEGGFSGFGIRNSTEYATMRTFSDAHHVFDAMTLSGNCYFSLTNGPLQFKLWDPGANKAPVSGFATGSYYVQSSSTAGSVDSTSSIDGFGYEQRPQPSLHCCYGWTEDWLWMDSEGELFDCTICPIGRPSIMLIRAPKFVSSEFTHFELAPDSTGITSTPHAAGGCVLVAMSLAVMETCIHSIQGIPSGIAGGCGKKRIGVYVSLVAFYLCGIPAADSLIFWGYVGGKGHWIGIQVGSCVQNVQLSVIPNCTNWKHQARNMRDLIQHAALSWEDAVDCTKAYPNSNLEDKVDLEQRGNDTIRGSTGLTPEAGPSGSRETMPERPKASGKFQNG